MYTFDQTIPFIMDLCLLCGLRIQKLFSAYVILCIVISLHQHVAHGDPGLPSLPDQFQTVIEATIVDRNLTMTGHEYYDGPGNRGVLQMSASKILDSEAISMIYDYANNQSYIVSGESCIVGDMQNSQNMPTFGNQTKGGRPHVVSTGGALRFAKKFGENYKGQTTVRGIRVDHWQSNLISWSFQSSNFTLDYYFTARNWTDAISFPQVPVRAIAKGIEVNDDGVTRNFTHYYEYVDFKPLITDASVFETPKGVVCIGRKKTKPVPLLPSAYHYRQEIITGHLSSDFIYHDITIADVWYDQTYRLLRTDLHMSAPTPPANTTDPLTEISDFNGGIQYIIDQVTGQCLVKSLDNSTFGVAEPLTTTSARNAPKIIHMKDPMQLFFLDNNYTFTGQRYVRGLQCNVFTELRMDFPVAGLDNRQTIFEYYFLADGNKVIPDDGVSTPDDVPVRLTVTIPSADTKITYNFQDFSTESPDISVFQGILRCYSESAKLQFTVKFPGLYKYDRVALLKLQAHRKFVAAMGVSRLRVQALKVNYDNAFFYISAMLLDRSFAQAQFTLRSSTALEPKVDQAYPYRLVGTVADCADACVNIRTFTCNSFEFCKDDKSRSCRFSKAHIGDGTSKVINSTCDHYSRTVNGPVKPELSMKEAYNNLTAAVYAGKLTLDGFQDAMQNPIVYTAVDVSIIFGSFSPQGVPALTGQFSYHLENTIPLLQSVYNTHVWYDFSNKLVRYDVVDTGTGQPMRFIHDYNSGLAYTINTLTNQCKISSITNTSDDAISPSASPAARNSTGFVLRMKNPLQTFDLTNKYKYVGQKTVREILCDVYENTAMFDFGDGTRRPSIFQMHFMKRNWSEWSANSGVPVATQPIRLVVTAVKGILTEYYDFFDFNEQQPDFSNFNIAPCFVGKQQHFLIKFNQTYHPTLDTKLATFMTQIQKVLSAAMGVSPLRLQNPQITYKGTWTYYIATIVEQAPYILDYTKTSNKSSIYSSDGTLVEIPSDQDCAKSCRTVSAFQCKSFDYCPGRKICQLSKRHVSDGNIINPSATCDHYSKTTEGQMTIEPTVQDGLRKLAGLIASGYITLPINTGAGKSVTYTAVMLDKNIQRRSTAFTDPSRTLVHFKRMSRQKLSVKPNSQVRGLSVDDCAVRCLRQTAFDCQSFDYCWEMNLCQMASANPSENVSVVTNSRMCNVYSRRFSYLHSYTAYPATFTKTVIAHTVSNVSSANLCARLCTRSSAFQCHSFDYCTTSQCYLSTKHIVDTAPAPTGGLPPLTCTHYSRRFLSDFTVTAHRSFSSGKSLMVVNVSAEACAELCVGQQCRAFTLCSSNCTMVFTSVITAQLQTTPMCGLYTKRHFRSPTKTPPPIISSAQKSSGYGGGTMAGVGIGILVMGVLLAASVMYFGGVKLVMMIRRVKTRFSKDTSHPEIPMKGFTNPVHPIEEE